MADSDLMPNAYPPRKKFSTNPVSPGNEVTDDNKTGGMRMIGKLAQAIKKGGKLRYPKQD